MKLPVSLAGTRWYVTAENLLAYMADPSLTQMTPVADQTVWAIDSADGGHFQGTSQAKFWAESPSGQLTPVGDGTTNALDGQVAEDGAVTILFTPEDPSQPQTVGYGHLREVDGLWRMEMQMATGTGMLAIHWAYMTPVEPGAPLPAPSERSLNGDLRSGEWRWMLGTAWNARDELLFPEGARFTITGYRNGYLWGDGEAEDGSSLRVAGSVTPEGTLYLLFSLAGESAVARRGEMGGDSEGGRMNWSQPQGGPIVGAAVRASSTL